MTDLQGKDADWWANRLFGGPSKLRESAKRFVGSPGVMYKGSIFHWESSPQGYDYWALLHEGSNNLEEAKSFVRWLLRGNIKDDSEET